MRSIASGAKRPAAMLLHFYVHCFYHMTTDPNMSNNILAKCLETLKHPHLCGIMLVVAIKATSISVSFSWMTSCQASLNCITCPHSSCAVHSHRCSHLCYRHLCLQTLISEDLAVFLMNFLFLFLALNKDSLLYFCSVFPIDDEKLVAILQG